ncbi:pyridoxal phosphate-dependent transferase [Syncephalis plumigaleata]|nr:pyridoxal phosphate-dependent transferase [Syncephalis plumigaleata]
MTVVPPISEQLPLGRSIPNSNLHAISVSIPSWEVGLDYRRGVPEVCERLQMGYPRFMFHARVMQLGKECLRRLAINVDSYAGLPMLTYEDACRCRDFIYKEKRLKKEPVEKDSMIVVDTVMFGKYNVHVVVYPAEDDATAKLYWELVGCGVCSRFADQCLNEVGVPIPEPLLKYNVDPATITGKKLTGDYLPEGQVDTAKQLIRQRIVDCIALTKENVYLYPGGMNAIFHLHRLLGFMESERKTVCYGFPYTNSLKVLRHIGAGSIFFGHGSEEEIDTLEEQLADPTKDRILSIFCEYPTNPLLKTPNIRRLRALADQYDIPLLIDGTVGGFSNSQLFPYADVMVVSLSKAFNGTGDLLSGCLIVNITRSHGVRLKHALDIDDGNGYPGYRDTLWWEDVQVLERNSRTFMERDARVNQTTEIICDYLSGGYGSLFSVILHTPEAAHAFFDALLCPKGPTFGITCTLACPYTILAHFNEQEWALTYNVPLDLIRMNIGLENVESIRAMFDIALAAIPYPDDSNNTN